jgi:WD40 repeat protein
MRYIKLVVCLVAVLFTAVAFAQATSALTGVTLQDSTSSTVAYAYVSSASNQNTYAFSVASDGKLTPVSGSPFATGYVASMAVNVKYLFVTDTVYIYSFAIASDGTIKHVASINAQQYNPGGNYGGPGALFLDRTGVTLYDQDFYCCGSDDAYQFFRVDNSTGMLSYLGVTNATRAYYVPLSFTGNNTYAYGAQCNGNMYWSIFGFLRNHDGTLSELSINSNTPKAKQGDFYCPNLSTADPTNHVAISMQAVNGSTFGSDGPPQLASYAADSLGNLTTTNTRFNMPTTAVKIVTDIAMSPSGKLLAVSGTAGLQIFHFNGSKPVTHYTGLLTNNPVDQVYWDNDNHLYATSQSAGKLFVFTVTPTGVSRAPGSPHKITKPQSIVVLSKK